MGTARIVGVVFLFLTGACAAPQRAPPSEPPKPDAKQEAPAAIEPAATPAPIARVQRPTRAAPSARAPAKVASASPPTEPARKPESVAPAPAPVPAQAVAKPPAAPSLDVKALESRLKDTRAIGLFTKIALKNQVDDLLGQFRDFYLGRNQTSLPELRRRYDQLVLKVLALLQDSDAPLAHEIVASRESLWSLLADRATFATI